MVFLFRISLEVKDKNGEENSVCSQAALKCYAILRTRRKCSRHLRVTATGLVIYSFQAKRKQRCKEPQNKEGLQLQDESSG